MTDLDALYRQLAPMLERLVARNISAPPALIEDACQFAWSSLLVRRDQVVQGRELGWLLTTASREVLRQLRAGRRELSIDLPDTGPAAAEAAADVTRLTLPDPLQVVTQRERLAQIHSLPLRQQRMVWLHGLGYDYEEISEETGDSCRTVQRQLLRAKHKLAAG
jgi:RNA polymerase sigma factor (sigma-70 family)